MHAHNILCIMTWVFKFNMRREDKIIFSSGENMSVTINNFFAGRVKTHWFYTSTNYILVESY